MPDAPIQHAFISYVHEDVDAVNQLASVLQAASIPVWKDTENLWVGEDWQQKIREAIESGSLAFIACFSSNSVSKSKTYMNAELNLAVDQIRLMPPGRVWFIPVRLDDCELPNYDLGGSRTLNSLQRIDLFGPAREASLGRLVAAIMGIFGTSTTSPGSVAAAIANASVYERGPRLAEAIKTGISDPAKSMEIEDLFLSEVRTVIEALKDEERFPLGGGPAPTVESLVRRAQEYDELVGPFTHAAITLGAWGTGSHASLATRAMARLAAITEEIRGGFTAYTNLRSYAVLPVLYAGVMGAVARSNGRMVAAFATDPTVSVQGQAFALSAVVNPWQPFQDSDTAASVLARLTIDGGSLEEQIAALQQNKVGKYYTPISEHLFVRLRTLADQFVLDDEEYQQLFHKTETFLALSELDFAATSDVVPDYRRGRSHWIGRIGHAERYLSNDAGLAQDFLREIQARKDTWWPLDGGMFGGDWTRAEAAATAYAENVAAARNRRF